ncbi:sulfatase family protein [Flavobacterium rhizosphaerae]|uniref:Sulfatase n=1 Tax=Flavobacterium rhizosphaerae TaxID=3163298 RepID=A0ABW8YSN6_9FLAO
MYTLLKAFIFTVYLSSGVLFAQSDKKPNVIIILMDDMGYGDTEPYGMTGIPTPNFNKIAAQGTRFTHFNVGQPVCTASRASLLTGSYPNRIGMAGVLLPGADRALNPKEKTIAAMLKDAGYDTAMLGKWHLGNKPPYMPIHYGFDSFYGIPYSHDVWPVTWDSIRVTNPKDIRYDWPAVPVYDGDKIVDSIITHKRASSLTAELTEKAVKFINAEKKKPFFLYLAHPMPHAPLVPSDRFKGKSGMGLFGDVIMELDWSLGEIMKALDENGIAENTILIVTSDNGPWLHFGDNAGSAGGFKEGKSTAFDGGTRVPFIIRWPSKVTAGDVNSSLITSMDILPTIAAATGSKLPVERIDGLNFLPAWTGNDKTGPRELYYYYYDGNSLRAIRYKNWKLVFAHTSNSYTGPHGRGGEPGKIIKEEEPMGLYDIAHDPGERYNVLDLYPVVVEKLKKYAQEARNDLGDGLQHIEPTNVRPAATVK